MFDEESLDSPNFYSRFGLTRKRASDASVGEAYRRLFMLCMRTPHPKREKSLWRARANRLNEAFEALYNQQARTTYDLTNPPSDESSQAQPSQAQPSQAQPSQAQPSQAQPSQAQPSQAQPSQAQPSQAQPSQAQPSQATIVDSSSSSASRKKDGSQRSVKARSLDAQRVRDTMEVLRQNSVIFDGIRVFLPPNIRLYESQQTTIKGILRVLRESEDGDVKLTSGLFESATGSGKTLSILSAVCAWLIDYKARRLKQCPHHSGSTRDPQACDCAARVTIYYCTKTFAQLSQVITEYEKLPYFKHHLLRHDILAGRDKLCVNRTVRAAVPSGDSSALAMQCHAKLASSKGCCASFVNLKSDFASEPRNIYNALRVNSNGRVWNLDDLRSTLDSLPTGSICPYFAARTLLCESADIVFSCYPYITNPVIRASTGLSLQDSVLVFDEGHNLLGQCMEDMKFTFNLNTMRTIRDETEKCADNARKLLGAYKGYEDRAPGITGALNERLSELSFIGRCLSDFIRWAQQRFRAAWTTPTCRETFVKKMRLCTTLEDDVLLETFGPMYFWDDLGEESSFETRPLRPLTHVTQACNAVYRFGGKHDGRFIKEPPVLTAMQDRSTKPNGNSLELLMRFFHMMTYYANYTDEFKCTIDSELNGGCLAHDHNFNVLLNEGKRCNVTFWARSPSVCMDVMRISGPRAMILASGTLSPTELVEKELSMTFTVKEANLPSVIPPTNVHAAVLAKGFSGSPLDGRYVHTADGNSTFYSDVAEFLVEASARVPGGLVCFLGSKAKLKMLLTYMNKNGHVARIKELKAFHYEDFGGNAEELIANHRKAVKNGTGSTLLSVFRSSLSEGINLAHAEARCVILAGMPYPDISDEYVRARFPSDTERHQWALMQCFVAINQAIGRSLRSTTDWSSTVLMDFRYAQFANRSRLPHCIQSNLELHSDPSKVLAAMSTFFDKFATVGGTLEPQTNFDPSPTKRARVADPCESTTLSLGSSEASHHPTSGGVTTTAAVVVVSDGGHATASNVPGSSNCLTGQSYRGPVYVVLRSKPNFSVYVLLATHFPGHRRTVYMSACRLQAVGLTEEALTVGCWYDMCLSLTSADENSVTLNEPPVEMDEPEVEELVETRVGPDGRLQVATVVDPSTINKFRLMVAEYVGYAYFETDLQYSTSGTQVAAWVALRPWTNATALLPYRNEWEVVEFTGVRSRSFKHGICTAAPVTDYAACYVNNEEFPHLLHRDGCTYHVKAVNNCKTIASYDCVTRGCSGRILLEFPSKDTTVSSPHNHV